VFGSIHNMKKKGKIVHINITQSFVILMY
jgi:hypothetical protein